MLNFLHSFPWLEDANFTRLHLALLIFSGLLVLWGLQRILRRRKASGKGFRACGCGLFIGAATLGYVILVAQLESYPALLSERETFEIHFTVDAENAEQTMIRLLSVSGTSNGHANNRLDTQWPLRGKEWRLTTRIIKGPGIGSRARLQRLVTRNTATEATHDEPEPHRAYVLGKSNKPDCWRFIHKKLSGLGLFATETVTTEFLPLEAGKYYRVALTDTRIILRELESGERKSVAEKQSDAN